MMKIISLSGREERSSLKRRVAYLGLDCDFLRNLGCSRKERSVVWRWAMMKVRSWAFRLFQRVMVRLVAGPGGCFGCRPQKKERTGKLVAWAKEKAKEAEAKLRGFVRESGAVSE